MNAAGLSLRHKHVISFIETLKPNWFHIRKLTPANEAPSAECYWRTGGWSRGHQSQADDNKLVSGSSL